MDGYLRGLWLQLALGGAAVRRTPLSDCARALARPALGLPRYCGPCKRLLRIDAWDEVPHPHGHKGGDFMQLAW